MKAMAAGEVSGRSVEERRIADLLTGDDEVAISGTVVAASLRRTARRLTILTALVRDGSGSIPCV